MPEFSIDINCDIGEMGFQKSSHQLELLDYVSSCNIATGFHAGDPYTAYRIIQKAYEKNLSIGAHPAYPDLANFGRKSMEMSREELFASLVYQISAMEGMCASVNARLQHIKLHGALYHDAHQREEVAEVVIQALKSRPRHLILYGQSHTLLAEMAVEHNIIFIPEAFSDRRYGEDGKLLARREKDAVIEDSNSVISQAVEIIRNQEVTTASGQKIPILARTLCIHGDHSNSINRAKELSFALCQMDIAIKPPKP